MKKPILLTWSLAAISSAVGQPGVSEPLFKNVSPEASGITFKNVLSETPAFNRTNYEYFYNGGGVAVGDINNDDLPDLYFTGNQVADALYLNKGAFHFEDITRSAGIKHENDWHTGVSMIDVNDDGWLDIYVCRSGLTKPGDRANLLYINNHDNTFTERAEEWGLADTGHSVQVAFFDYDQDGDLDCYLLNHPVGQKNFPIGEYYAFRAARVHESDRLYRNDGERFTDVTIEAGLFDYGFRHGVAVGDINNDGWPDLYVCTDFDEPDRLYINRRGRFVDEGLQWMKHTSMFSMGCDLADFNNDGLLDVFVADMTPESHVRSKRNMASMDTDRFKWLVKAGFNYQYMVNSLQLNTGSSFQEIAQVSGVSKTDWSWATLFADLDNDGWKDLFVTNGVRRDVLDNDAKAAIAEMVNSGDKVRLSEVLDAMPQNTIPNYVFRNTGELTFENTTQSWGLDAPQNSNGAVYSDLDRDGDLDLVLNNVDAVASLYENTTSERAIRIALEGPRGNRFGLGTRVHVESSGVTQLQELYLTRGYLSSVEPVLHFGLGAARKANVKVYWPDGRFQEIHDADKNLLIKHSESVEQPRQAAPAASRFSEIGREVGLTLRHHENKYDDFARELLLPHKQSENGPLITTGDVNMDGLADIYFPGAKGFGGELFYQTADELFATAGQGAWHGDRAAEDAGSLFFDADNDNDIDLYVVSGGNEEPAGSDLYQDRLYLNDGEGNFSKSEALPRMPTSGSVVITSDFDNDSDLDLFVGGRVVPGGYPEAPRSYLLENRNGEFVDVTDQRALGLSHIGMVTEATFSDYDSDGDEDLLLVGEWMPFTVFENQDGVFSKAEVGAIGCTAGWWFSISANDLDNDGDTDYILGNIGGNNKFHPTAGKPLKIYANDFDATGSRDIVLAKAEGEGYFPVRGRECSSEQMPFIVDKFPTFKEFAEANINMIYEDGLQTAIALEACEMQSLILWNDGAGSLRKEYLPIEAQLAPLRGIVVSDVNGDGKPDILAAGNMYGAEVETPRYDAGVGICLVQSESGFQFKDHRWSGFFTPGDVRDVELLWIGDRMAVIVANNRGLLQVFGLR